MEQLQPQFNSGANSLTNVLHGVIKGISDKPNALDFGRINADMSLTTNSLGVPIPPDSYSVCRSVLYSPSYPLTEDVLGVPRRLPKDTKVTIEDGAHIHACGSPFCPWPMPSGQHWHWTELPRKMRRLQPGDKVLVAWVANEAVVIDLVYDAKYLLSDEEPDWQ